VKRRTKNIIAYVVFVAVCVVPTALVIFWSYMVASGRTARSIQDRLASQLDLRLEITDIRQVGPIKTAVGVVVKDYRGEREILRADKMELTRSEDGTPLFNITNSHVMLADKTTAADVLTGVNKLLRTHGMKTVNLKCDRIALKGLLEGTFEELLGSVDVDGKNIRLSAEGIGRDTDDHNMRLKLVEASLHGRELEFDLEISREGRDFVADSLKPFGPLVASFVRDFTGNQVVKITHEGVEERFKRGTFNLDLRGFYRAAGLEKDYFNSFGESYITEIEVGPSSLRGFDVRVIASPAANDRKVFSRRFLYSAHYLLTGKYLLIPRDRDEYPFTAMSFDVGLKDNLYTFKGHESTDGQWILPDRIALKRPINIPPVDVTVEPEELARRWAAVKKFNAEGWPQESLAETTAESLQQLLELADKRPPRKR